MHTSTTQPSFLYLQDSYKMTIISSYMSRSIFPDTGHLSDQIEEEL